MLQTTLAGSLPKPTWLAEPERAVGAVEARRAPTLEQAKLDATILAVKLQEDAGIDIVSDGEQARMHFVHGFLAKLDGIDFEQEDRMGIRDNRYDAEVPTVVGPIRRKGRVHETEAQAARAHTQPQAQVHAARADDHRRHARRRALRQPAKTSPSPSPSC